MDTTTIKTFAQSARRTLMNQVSTKLDRVRAPDSAAHRENPAALQKLEEAIKREGKNQVIERVAYTWFNRFCALRFMDINQYTSAGILSPAENQSQPEILADAKMGHIDEDMVSQATRQRVTDLLNGKIPSQDAQGEAYRLLVVAACNYWHKAMPFMFEHISDYTELLMPDDLLSANSILAETREAMTPEACESVEVIGWLYQFYISERKDDVFAGLKKKKKITAENIPAATQLFTPHWIVRYLVQNSLGRLWMLNNPNSALIEQMEYYIKPEQPETDFLRITSPEEIKVCDPACGSGHMLTYAFDLLYAIYEEQGYAVSEIPEKILTRNLYGIELDGRASALAAFALTMKARKAHRRFFRNPVQPNICLLENIHFTEKEITNYKEFVGPELFTTELQTTLHEFEEANNFGSLIRPTLNEQSTDIQALHTALEAKGARSQVFLADIHNRVCQVLEYTDYLSPKYHVIVANPPYMGGRGMNASMKKWVGKNFPNSKADLFAIFIERNLELAMQAGAVAMITMQSWMFLSSYEKLRARILDQNTIISMAHLGARAFDSIGGEVVSTTAFVLENQHKPEYQGAFLRLVDGNSEAEKQTAFKAAINQAG